MCFWRNDAAGGGVLVMVARESERCGKWTGAYGASGIDVDGRWRI